MLNSKQKGEIEYEDDIPQHPHITDFIKFWTTLL